MYGVELFKKDSDFGPGVATSGYKTEYKFSPDGDILNIIINGTPWYPEWYGEQVLHKGTKQRVHMNGDSGRDVGLHLEESGEIYLNGDFESIVDNARGDICFDGSLVGARPYAVEMSKIEKYMKDAKMR